MKLRALFSACLAGASLVCFAQTDKEGIEYYSADQLNNARELLNRNMNNSGTNKAAANYYLGLIAQREGNIAEAQKYFQTGITTNPEYPFNYVGLGQIALANNPKEASGFFKQAEKFGKKNAALEVAIARAYYDTDPVKYAKEIAKRTEKAQKIDMSDPAVYIFMGDQAVDQKDWGVASGMYEMATNYDPQATGAYVKYANMYKNVNPQYSIQMLKNLLKANPNSALGQRQLANTYYDLEKYKEAADAYGQYVKNPNHFKQDEDRYSFLLFADGDYKDGYEYATSLLAADPDNFNAQRYQFMNAAQIEALAPQLLGMAEGLYKKHTSDPAKYPFAAIDYTLISSELSKDKRFDEAKAVLEEGIREIPAQKSFVKDLALVYYDSDNTKEALNQMQKYVNSIEKLGYNDAYLMSNLAYVASFDDSGAEKQKDFQLAADYAKKALEANPKNYRPLKRLGDIAGLSEAADAAAQKGQYYVQAIQVINDNNLEVPDADARELYKTAGVYLFNSGDKAAAKALLEKYQQLNPSDAQINGILKKF